MADDLVKGLGFDELERKLDVIYDKLSNIITLLDSKKGGSKITLIDSNTSKEVQQLAQDILVLKKRQEELMLQEKQATIDRKQQVADAKAAVEEEKLNILRLKAAKEDLAAKEIQQASARKQRNAQEMADSKMAIDAAKLNILTIKKAQNELALQQRQNAVKKSQLTQQEKVDAQFLAQNEKLKAQAISQTATELQRLYALQELASRKAGSLYVQGVEQQSQAYMDAAAQAKKYGEEIYRLENASGKLRGKTTSMYGATFQLTQVMRELPNFAMSSRIGFMSLSNNLPMLIDSFKILSQQINELTGKPYGMAGAFKVFAKSLLSLNTVMIVASTLLVLYGDKIGKWISNITAADVAYNLFLKSLRDGDSEYSKQYSELNRLIGIFENIDGVYITNKNALDEYNKSFGEHLGKAKDIEEAYKKLKEYGYNYILVMSMIQQADILKQESSKLVAQAQAELNDVVVSGWQIALERVIRFGKAFANIFTLIFEWKKVFSDDNFIASSASIKEDELAKRKEKSNKLTNDAKVLLDDYFKKMKEAYDYAVKHKIDLFPDEINKNGGSSGDREAKIKYFELEYYSKERERLIKEIAELELQSEKTTTNGVEQEFSSRYAALRGIMQRKIELINIEGRDEAKNLQSRLDKQTQEVNDAIAINDKLYKDKKISLAEYEIAQKRNFESLENLTDNYVNDITKLTDKATKDKLAIEKRAIDETMKILKEEQKERFELIKEETNQKLAQLQKQNNQEQSDEKKRLQNTVAFLLDIENAQMGSEMRQLEIAYKTESEKQKILQDDLKQKIAINEAIKNNDALGAEKRKAAELLVAQYKEDLRTQELQSEEELAKKRIAIEEYVANKTAEIKKDTFKTTQDAILETIKGFYERYYELLDKERDYFTDVEKNKETDVDNRVKAGVISEEEAEDEKNRIKVWAEANQKAIDEREKKAKKEQFLLDQAIALGKVAIAVATGIAEANAMAPITAGASLAMIPWIIASGIAQAALITAQSIPYFEKGGIADRDTLAVVGEKRHEVIESDRGLMITPNIPTLTRLSKGDKIYPSIQDYVSKLNIAKSDNKELSKLQEKQLMLMLYKSDTSLLNETKGLRKDIRNLKLNSNVKVINDYSTLLKYANKKKGLLG